MLKLVTLLLCGSGESRAFTHWLRLLKSKTCVLHQYCTQCCPGRLMRESSDNVVVLRRGIQSRLVGWTVEAEAVFLSRDNFM